MSSTTVVVNQPPGRVDVVTDRGRRSVSAAPPPDQVEVAAGRDYESVVATIAGPQGPKGDKGDKGDPGIGGGGSGASYVFTQASPAASWLVVHNLGRFPDVTVIVGGEEVTADVHYNDTSSFTVIHGSPQAGQAVYS